METLTKKTLTVEERVHAVCNLLNEGKTTDEVCKLVEHGYCTDVVFKQFVTGVRYGKIRPEISKEYGYPTGPTTSVRNNEKIELALKEKITEMFNAGKSAKEALHTVQRMYPVDSEIYHHDLVKNAYKTLKYQRDMEKKSKLKQKKSVYY